MKPLSEQDHYEILEIPLGAGPDEIERAYHVVSATYADDALANYSVFDSAETEALRERIELAYRVLSDDEARRAYDAALGAQAAPAPPAPPPVLAAPRAADAGGEPLPELEDFAEQGEGFDGARLRRARLRRGLELDDVVRVTKVNPTYLRFIEEDRFEDLPARVYVRGFVSAYAACVGLDPRRVADLYMSRFDREVPKQKRRSGRR